MTFSLICQLHYVDKGSKVDSCCNCTVCVVVFSFFENLFIFHRLERGTKPVLTPHDASTVDATLVGVGFKPTTTCVLVHCATGAHIIVRM